LKTKVHDDLKEFADEIAKVNKKIGRLETLIEVQALIETQAEKSKSVYEVRALTNLLEKLKDLT
jgi:hypothetical protein